jgi:prepilin-type N-terminal cleavage/methylation domain-containing protein
MRTRDDSGFTLVELLVVILIIAILFAVMVPLMLGMAPSDPATSEAAARAAQEAARQAAAARAADEPFDFGPLLAVLASVVGLAVVGTASTLTGLKVRNHRRARRDAKAVMAAALKDRAVRLRTARDLLDETAGAYAAFESDLVAVLRTPLLCDVTVPTTATFVTALKRATSAAPETDSPSLEHLERFEAAVTDLSTSWRTAHAYATKSGLSTLDPASAKAVRRARDLLTLALDPASSPSERAVAHERALKLLEGVVLVPERARAELESRVALALTSAPHEPSATSAATPVLPTPRLGSSLTKVLRRSSSA